MHKNAIDETGNRYGTLTVLRVNGKYRRKYKWLCVCDCGHETTVMGESLRSGRAKCKSCVHIKHGGAKKHRHTAEYRTWQSIKRRCTNPSQQNYERYGGRGIRMCQEWMESFAAFLEHVGKKPSPEHSIDRIDCNGHYEPGNVRWATRLQQARNRRPRKKVKR